MLSLPYEILVPIFHDLNKNDLLQCQVVNKQWYTASLELLYSDIMLHTADKGLLYIRTISDSPRLGKCLNAIFFNYVLGGVEYDKHGILKTIIQHCPNIVELECWDQKQPLWTQLIYAREHGQLSQLKVLPEPDGECLEPYILTSLLFKDSLTALHLSDDGPPYDYQLFGSAAFQILCDEIDQFKNLQSLVFICSYNKYLSSFDGLIDRCHNLKELTYDVEVEGAKEESDKPEITVLPRPDIRMLECNWRQVNTESRLGYVIHKFPSLQRLKITSDSERYLLSGFLVMNLIQYALSIPDFEINLYVKKEDILNIWDEFIKVKNGCKNLVIGNYDSYRNSNFCYHVTMCVVRGFDLVLPASKHNNELPHIWFFSKVGGNIRSLTVNGPEKARRINGETSPTLHWFFDILRLCPLMKEITVNNSKVSSPNTYELRDPSIKKLIVNGIEYTKPNNFLANISLNFPTLHQLCVKFNETLPKIMDPITIHMPHTSIDLLVWDEIKCKYFKEGGNFFIKLNTDTGLKFYEGNKYKLTPVDSSRYLSPSALIRFDIHCKSLKRLEISKTHFSFIF